MAENDSGDSGTTDDGGSGSGGAPSWSPPASQEDLDKIIGKAVARAHAKYADYDDLKSKAARMEELEFELSSEADKKAKAARDEERAKVRGEFAPRVVRAEFRAEAKGVLSKDQLDALLEDVDLSRYVDNDGEPDRDKIAAKVAKFAPKKDDRQAFPDLGAGRRGGSAHSMNMNDLIRRQAGIGT